MKSNAVFFNTKQEDEAAKNLATIKSFLEKTTGGQWSDGAIVAMLLRAEAARLEYANEVKHAS
jgi:hypothetical protein